MTFTLSMPLLIGLGLSLALFAFATWACSKQGLFKDGGYPDFNPLFVAIFYAALWLLPSFAGWAIYATWFTGAPA